MYPKFICNVTTNQGWGHVHGFKWIISYSAKGNTCSFWFLFDRMRPYLMDMVTQADKKGGVGFLAQFQFYHRMSNFYCHIFGHRFRLLRKVTSHIKEYHCVRCRKEVTMGGNGKVCALTDQMKEINDTLEDMFRKRGPRTAKYRDSKS